MSILQQLKKNQLLSELCTLGIGGPAQSYVEVSTIEELKTIIAHCYREKLPYFLLGNGSNLVFDDRGFAGLVIHCRISFCQFDQNSVYVGAGYSFSLLGTQTARRNLSGLEFASGIPATVGGAIFMNAGANGSETMQCLQSVLFIDEKGEERILKKHELEFSYRFSSFHRWKGAIAAANFSLNTSEKARPQQLSLIKYRVATQPYQDKSAGCFFRNPIPMSAGALIDQCGLKGVRVGGASVSTMHANFIVNSAQATSRDVYELSELVRNKVKEKTGVELEYEVRFIPYTSGEQSLVIC